MHFLFRFEDVLLIPMGLDIHPPLKKKKQTTNPSGSLGNELVSHFFVEREHEKNLCHSEYCEFSTFSRDNVVSAK